MISKICRKVPKIFVPAIFISRNFCCLDCSDRGCSCETPGEKGPDPSHPIPQRIWIALWGSAYKPYGKDWIKQKVYQHLRKQAA